MAVHKFDILETIGELRPAHTKFQGGIDEKINTIVHNAAGVLTLNVGATGASAYTVEVRAAITSITFSNPPPTGRVGTVTVFFDFYGNHAITHPAAVEFDFNVVPTFPTVTGKTAIITYTTRNGGTRWYASSGGTNFDT